MKSVLLTLLATAGAALGQICLQHEIVCAPRGKAMAKAGMSMSSGNRVGCQEVCVHYSAPTPSLRGGDHSHGPNGHLHGNQGGRGHRHGGHHNTDLYFDDYYHDDYLADDFYTYEDDSNGPCTRYEVVCGQGSDGGCATVCVEYGAPIPIPETPVPVPLPQHQHGGYVPVPVPVPVPFPVMRPFSGGKAMMGSMGMMRSKGQYYYDDYYYNDDYYYSPVPIPVTAPLPIIRPIVGGKAMMGSTGMMGSEGGFYDDDYYDDFYVDNGPCLRFEIVCTTGGKAMAKAGMGMMGSGGGVCRQVCVEFGVPANVPIPSPVHSHSHPRHSHHATPVPTHSHTTPTHGHNAPTHSHAGSSHNHGIAPVPTPAGPVCLQFDVICTGPSGTAMAKGGMGMMGSEGGSCRQVCLQFGSPSVPEPVPSPTHSHSTPRHSHTAAGHSRGSGYGPVSVGTPTCLQYQLVCTSSRGKAMAKGGMSMMGSEGGSCHEVCVQFGSPPTFPAPPTPIHSHSLQSPTHSHSFPVPEPMFVPAPAPFRPISRPVFFGNGKAMMAGKAMMGSAGGKAMMGSEGSYYYF